MRIWRARPLQIPPGAPSCGLPRRGEAGWPPSPPAPPLGWRPPPLDRGRLLELVSCPQNGGCPTTLPWATGAFPAPHTPLYSKKSECSPRSSPRAGQAPSPLSPQAGRGRGPSATAPVSGDGPRAAPTPQPACRCPVPPRRSLPLPLARTACRGRADCGAEGPERSEEEEGRPPLPSLTATCAR